LFSFFFCAFAFFFFNRFSFLKDALVTFFGSTFLTAWAVDFFKKYKNSTNKIIYFFVIQNTGLGGLSALACSLMAAWSCWFFFSSRFIAIFLSQFVLVASWIIKEENFLGWWRFWVAPLGRLERGISLSCFFMARVNFSASETSFVFVILVY